MTMEGLEPPKDQTQRKVGYLDQNLGIRTNSVYEIFILTMASLSMLSAVVILFVPGTENLSEILLVINSLATVIFLIDFLRSLFRSQNRSRYLFRWGWLDLIGALPIIPFFRFALLPRAVRAFWFIRAQRSQEILADMKNKRAETTVYGTVVVSFLAFVIISSLVLLFERESPIANIKTTEDAVWWALVTITTVGYGDYFPVTVGGRILASILMVVGVGVFSVLTGYLARSFLSGDSGGEDLSQELLQVKAELEKIQRQISTQRNNGDLPGPQEEKG